MNKPISSGPSNSIKFILWVDKENESSSIFSKCFGNEKQQTDVWENASFSIALNSELSDIVTYLSSLHLEKELSEVSEKGDLQIVWRFDSSENSI